MFVDRIEAHIYLSIYLNYESLVFFFFAVVVVVAVVVILLLVKVKRWEWENGKVWSCQNATFARTLRLVCVCVWYLVCELTWKLKSSLKREVLSVDRSGNSENQQRHFSNFNLSKWHIRSHTQQQHIVHTYARRLSVFVVFVSALKSISGPRNWFIHYWTFRHRIVGNRSSSFRSFLVYQKRNVVTRAPFRFELLRCFLPFSTVVRFFHFNNIVNIDFSEVQRKKVCNTKTEKFAY